MKLNLKARLGPLYQIVTGRGRLFKCADLASKMKLVILSMIKIPFSTYCSELTLRFGSLSFRCLGSYEMDLYPEIFVDKVYTQIPIFDPKNLNNGYTVVDIGANVGFYSICVSSINPFGKIYAFEPHPQALERLKKNVKKNNIENVEIIEKAIWSKDGNINFEAHKFTVLSRIKEGQKTEFTVSSLTLDSFVEQYKIAKIDILKIDAEFAEDEVILGAESRALAITEKIVLEYHLEKKKNKIENILEAHRFQKLKQNGRILYFAQKI